MMKPYSFEQLEKYLDNELPAAERSAINTDLNTDEELKNALTALIASAEAVRYYGTAAQVAAIQQEFLATREHFAPAKKPAVVRHIMRPALRVAASLIILAAAFAVYKYSTVNPRNVAAEYYAPYELNRVRGEASANALENAYNSKDWNAVVRLADQQQGSKELFLSGAACLELNQPAKAADKFNRLLAYNQQTQSNYYQDEAEYYLAISYITNNDAAKAIPILQKIRADEAHLYHEKATKISMLDLRILSWKK